MSSLAIPTGASPILPDYVYHFSEYAALGFLCVRMLARDEHASVRLGPFLAALVFCLAYAALDEVHQAFVVSRSASLKDLATDVVGILVGMLVYQRLSGGMHKEAQP